MLRNSLEYFGVMSLSVVVAVGVVCAKSDVLTKQAVSVRSAINGLMQEV
jgi:hypothetical protein